MTRAPRLWTPAEVDQLLVLAQRLRAGLRRWWPDTAAGPNDDLLLDVADELDMLARPITVVKS